ncbi:MAG: glycosyltransferase family 2 protein [Eubacteriales bacterium]
MKKVSLILTTYNCKAFLIQTLDCIEKQTYPNLEIVIVDGASSDGTLEIIKEYAKSNNNTKWISEKDKGIYDAINKGIDLATGDYIEIMNDRYTRDDAIEKMVQVLEQNTECVGIHTDLVYMEGNQVKRYWKMGQGNIYQGWMPGHPTLLLKKEIYEQYGRYDTMYVCSADYEFMVRFLKDKKNQLAYVPETLVAMYYGGTSNATFGSYMVSLKESYMALRKNKVSFALWICGLRTLRVLGQFVKK